MSGFFIQPLSIWQQFYQCLLWVLCHVVIPLHVLAVSAKHCNILVYHLSNTVPYLFPAVQIHSKRYYCGHYMQKKPSRSCNGRTSSEPKGGAVGGRLKSKKHPDRKWWFNCWESTPCNMVTDLDVGNSARMMEFPICDEFSGERFWPILIRTSLEVTLRGGSICKSCQNGWHQTGYSNSITQIGYDG